MLRILIQEGADLKVLGHFFKAVVQELLLFGAEAWVLSPRMEQALSSFQHRVAQWHIRRQKRSIAPTPTPHLLFCLLMSRFATLC